MAPLGISVVIPTYNRAHLVGRAIRNALALAEPDDEVIVVDDGSKDNTAEVVKGFGERVRFIAAPHGGAGAARNHGVRAATKPLVAFLDSDDEWMPDKFVLQRTVMARRPDVLFCFSDFAGRNDRGVEPRYLINWHHDPRPWDEILGPGFLYSSLAPLPPGRADFKVHVGSMYFPEMVSDYIATTTFVVRREMAGDAFRFGEDIVVSEDKECFVRLAAKGPAAYLDAETSWQWEHPGPRVTDDNTAYNLATARITILERTYGRDPAFLAQHRAAYEAKLREQHLLKARWLIAKGRTGEARESLRRAAPTPWSYRIMAALPGPLAQGVLGVRRALRMG